MYNIKRGRKGTFWAERFKSVIVEKGETLINCLVYIDLNPVRAGLVDRPEDYRWSSLGYRFQFSSKDEFLRTRFFTDAGIIGSREFVQQPEK